MKNTCKGKHVSSVSHIINKMLNQSELQNQKPTTTSHPCRSIAIPEETLQHGEDFSSILPPQSPTEPTLDNQSSFCSVLSIQSNSQEGDGCLLSRPTVIDSTRAMYWAITSWEQDLTWERVLVSLSSMGMLVVSILGSQSHMCWNNEGPHRHWLVKMSRQIRKSQFPLVLRQTCWVAPVIGSGKDTLQEAIRKYILYIRGKGASTIERGVPFRTHCQSKNTRTKNEEIMDMVLEKKRCLEMSEVPTTPAERIQACPFPATTRIPD